MSNPASQAASLVRISPGTAVMAVAGVAIALIGVDAARFVASKAKSATFNVAGNIAGKPTSTGTGNAAGWA